MALFALMEFLCLVSCGLMGSWLIAISDLGYMHSLLGFRDGLWHRFGTGRWCQMLAEVK
jgi:hypothetical protein